MIRVALPSACAVLILAGTILLKRGGAVPPDESRGVTDFQASFMTWDLPRPADMRGHNIPLGNKARIQIDAMIDVIEEDSGKAERYVLIAPCRTEWVYAKDHLFQIPSNEYRFIFSLTEQRGVPHGLAKDSRLAIGKPVSESFRSLRIDVHPFAHSHMLMTAQEINAVSDSGTPMVGRTEFRDPVRKVRYVLEYPIKTMNFRPESASFQVDTGPLLVPDMKSNATKAIDRLELAHVCYNQFDRAEFILRRLTTSGDKGQGQPISIFEYSDVQEHPARNEIYSAE